MKFEANVIKILRFRELIIIKTLTFFVQRRM